MAGLGSPMAKSRKHKPHPENRKRTTNPKVHETVPGVSKLAFSPVSRILSDAVGDWGDSRVAELAARIEAEPFDIRKFRDEIIHKLDRAIPRNRAYARRVTFLDRLTYAALATILEDSTLRELRNCLLIPRIFDRDRELERNYLSAAGSPLPEHRKLYQEAQARMREIEKQAEIDGTTTDTEEYRRLYRQFLDNINLLILSKRYPGSRKQLLSGQPVKGLTRKPRRKEVAVLVAIFWVLRSRLPSEVSDRFIHQLAVLISDPRPYIGDSILVRAAEALRKAVADDPAEWEKLLDRP